VENYLLDPDPASVYYHGFSSKNGVFTTVDDPLGINFDCGLYNVAYAVNASGAIVGRWDDFCSFEGNQNGYLFQNGVYTTIYPLSRVESKSPTLGRN